MFQMLIVLAAMWIAPFSSVSASPEHASYNMFMDVTTLTTVVEPRFALDSKSGVLFQLPGRSIAVEIPRESMCRATPVSKFRLRNSPSMCRFGWITAGHCLHIFMKTDSSRKKLTIEQFHVSNGDTDIKIPKNYDWRTNTFDGGLVFYNKPCRTIPDEYIFPLGNPISEEEIEVKKQFVLHGAAGKSSFSLGATCRFSPDDADRICMDRNRNGATNYKIIPGNSGSTIHELGTGLVRAVVALSTYATDGGKGDHIGSSRSVISWAKEMISKQENDWGFLLDTKPNDLDPDWTAQTPKQSGFEFSLIPPDPAASRDAEELYYPSSGYVAGWSLLYAIRSGSPPKEDLMLSDRKPWDSYSVNWFAIQIPKSARNGCVVTPSTLEVLFDFEAGGKKGVEHWQRTNSSVDKASGIRMEYYSRKDVAPRNVTGLSLKGLTLYPGCMGKGEYLYLHAHFQK